MDKRRIDIAAIVVLMLASMPARAVIERPYPLEAAIKDSEFIFVAKVDKLDPDKPSAVLTVGDALKGKVPFTRLPINLTGDADSKKKKETPQLLKRLAPKLPVIVFVTKEDKQYLALVYTNGTWFQMIAEEGENPVWAFTHVEPYLRRSFKGTTAEMQQTLADAIAGKTPPPKVDAKVKPGLGPEVEEKPKEKDSTKNQPRAPARGSLAPSLALGARGRPVMMAGFLGGPLFALIPSVAIGGFLSLLAMIFPTVFGGLTGQIKRWIALISVASLNTTLLWVFDFFDARLQGSWWGTSLALWLTMIVVTLLGVMWAWRRQLQRLTATAEPSASAPSEKSADGSRVGELVPPRFEQIFLLTLSGSGALLFGFCLTWNYFRPTNSYNLLALPWSFVLSLWIGIWTATLYVLWVRWRGARPRTGPALASEGVALWAMLPACLILGCSSASVVQGDAKGGGAAGGEDRHQAHFLKATAVFAPAGTKGVIVAQPLIDADHYYVTTATQGKFNTSFGNLYCVERAGGRVKWDFNSVNKLQMKEGFSSPCLANGKLYVGEGWHQDSSCQLYCIDAATGKKLWSHPTSSHTESSPCVVDGKVYCGAGDEGLLCLNAETGDEVWHYDKGHVDCPPLVVGDRVYCGTGVDRDLKEAEDDEAKQKKALERAIFCLDAASGKEIWRVKTDLPAWGKPFVGGDLAYFPLGNGDAFNQVEPPEKPAGAIVCVSARDGKQVWRYDVSDGVLDGPAVDAERVYFGCRDGHCYCIGRYDGQFRWKYDVGSPVVVPPALGGCSLCGGTNSVYAIGRDGKVCCLNSVSGHPMWERHDFPAAKLLSPPVVFVDHTPQGDHRSVYFGAGVNRDEQVVLYCLEDLWKEE